ncbi:MAG: hypothetical protein PQJ45_09650 [Sphaerochaetaceae bacterium]|nr:hypothetical protein [Sphaerochaetaceae bacterium]MDC7238022.1 hypothetical protein [Sphaerochaetaceae bacterium]MDC7244080.1 hypothetical protein [Sphaerochaetaceae bacterium]
MKKIYLFLIAILLISVNSLFSATDSGSILLNVDIEETGPIFSMYKAESSDDTVTGVTPVAESVSETLNTDSLLTDNLASTSIYRYYFFVGSNFQESKALNVTISSSGFTNENTTTTVPINTEIIAPQNDTFSTSTSYYTLSSTAEEVISDYTIQSGYYLEPYTSSSNYTIPDPDTFNSIRNTSTTHLNKELFFMELGIGWSGESKLPAGSYSATIQVAYSVN